MRKLVSQIIRLGYAFLAFAPMFLWIGQMAMEDYRIMVIALAALVPFAAALALMPARLGSNRRKFSDASLPSRNDPDPDRNLRSDSHEAVRNRKGFPLRVVVCAIISLAAFGVMFFLPVEPLRSAIIFVRLGLAAVVAVALPIILVAMRSEEIVSGNGVTMGLVSYAVSGIIIYVIDQPELGNLVMGLGVVFLLITAFFLNDRSLAAGSVFRGAGMPASIKRRNRFMLLALAALVGIIAIFDNIRLWTRAAANAVMRAIGTVFGWIASLFNTGQSTAGISVAPAGGDDPMMLEPGEPALFWVIMEKVAFVVAAILIVGIVVFVIWKFYGKIKAMFRRIAAFFKRFSRSIETDYEDERESLIDWSEAQRSIGDSLRKRWARLTYREKRWEQMDARERVRFLVKSLFRKHPDAASPSRTAREALGAMDLSAGSAAHLTSMYDLARYSEHALDANEIETMRKEIRP